MGVDAAARLGRGPKLSGDPHPVVGRRDAVSRSRDDRLSGTPEDATLAKLDESWRALLSDRLRFA